MGRRICLVLVPVFILVFTLAASPALAQLTPKYVLPVSKVTLSRTSAKVYAGRSFTIQAKVAPASRAHEAVLWSTSDAAVATVEGGVVTALSPGTATITATVEDKSAVCQVTVRKAKVTAIKLSNSSIALTPSSSLQLSVAAFTPAYATDTVTWNSQNPAVATVDPDTGLVTGVSLGSTRVRARTAGGKTAFCTVTVTDAVTARSISLSASTKNLTYGDSFRLTASILPANTDPADLVLTWSSNKPSIATVDENGLVTAGNQPGTATITAATPSGRSAKCKVTVKYIAVKSVALDQSSLVLDNGKSATLTATVTPAGAADRTVAWSSSDEAVATVQEGVVTATGAGTATITATVGDHKASCKVTVRSLQALVTITAGGDVTIGGDPRRQAPASQAWYEQLYNLYGGNFLGGLSQVFNQSHEITLINLESNFTTASTSSSKTYVFRAQPSYASVLSQAGVDVVSHANNHSADFGSAGARSTRTAVTGQGMSYISGATTTIQRVNGVSVGFCAFNQTGGNVTSAMQSAIKKLKNNGCDIVVVSLHWGTEYVYASSAAQRNLGRAAINAGADLVVGHHSHVVSGVEQYKGKYIVYGLGTLSSAILTPDDMDAILFQQTFKVDVKSGLVQSGPVQLIPVSMSTDENTNDARPYILEGSARQRVLNKVKYYSRNFTQTLPEKCFS